MRLRHKIEKAGAAKQRKQRKLAKKNPEWRSRLKKDPGIPNLFPYKEKILQEIEEKRRLKEEEYARKREESRANKEEVKVATGQQDPLANEEQAEDEVSDLLDEDSMEEGEDDGPADSNPMSALLASARARAVDYGNRLEDDEEVEDDDDDGSDAVMEDVEPSNVQQTKPSVGGRHTLDTSRRSYDKIFKSVLASSDILLYVLDARDPNGTRSQDIEREIAAADGGSKRLLLIINKIDLVPPPVLKAWLTYLRRFFPTLPLRANTSAPNAKTFDHKALTAKASSEALLRALKSYAHSKQLKRSITVGVVGYPNVGKSSVINILISRLGSRNASNTVACPVGAEAGVTTSLREVKLDGKLKLLDSPGIVFPSIKTTNETTTSSQNHEADKIPHLSSKQLQEAHLTLLSAIPPSSITDPIPAVTLLLHRLSKNSTQLSSFLDYYNLTASTLIPSGPDSNDVTSDFLIQVARKRGRLGKGGVPNLQSAAMGTLMDWRDGRIQGWVEPPKIGGIEAAGKEGGLNGSLVGGDRKEIVSQWAEEFKLDGLWGDESNDKGTDGTMEQ